MPFNTPITRARGARRTRLEGSGAYVCLIYAYTLFSFCSTSERRRHSIRDLTPLSSRVAKGIFEREREGELENEKRKKKKTSKIFFVVVIPRLNCSFSVSYVRLYLHVFLFVLLVFLRTQFQIVDRV